MGSKSHSAGNAKPVFKARFRDKVSAVLDVMIATPSAEELNAPISYRGGFQERFWAATSAVIPKFENPVFRAQTQAEVMGIARRVGTRRGLMATVMLLAMSSPSWGQAPAAGSLFGEAMNEAAAPPIPGGEPVSDSPAWTQRGKFFIGKMEYDIGADGVKYLQYLNQALIGLKAYKQVRQMYNRVASGRIDLVLLPSLPTVSFDLPSTDANGNSGTYGSQGGQVGPWTHTTIHFLPSSQSDREAIYGQLPQLAPKINIAGMKSQLMSLVGGMDPDVVAQNYSPAGQLLKPADISDMAMNTRLAAADGWTAWLFSYHQLGIDELLSAPQKFQSDRTTARLAKEDEALQGMYQILLNQQRIDNSQQPYLGPSVIYQTLQTAYNKMSIRRQAMTTDASILQAQKNAMQVEAAKTQSDMEYYTGQRVIMDALAAVPEQAKAQAAKANQDHGSKETGHSTNSTIPEVASGGTIVGLAGENTDPSHQMEFLIKNYSAAQATNEQLKLLGQAIVGEHIRAADLARTEQALKQKRKADGIRAMGGVLSHSTAGLALMVNPPKFPPLLMTMTDIPPLYALDVNGNMTPSASTAPSVAPPVTMAPIDLRTAAGQLAITTNNSNNVQTATTAMRAQIQQAGQDMSTLMSNNTGFFAGDFLSQLYAVVASGFTSIFRLKAFNLTGDTAALKSGNATFQQFKLGYTIPKS